MSPVAYHSFISRASKAFVREDHRSLRAAWILSHLFKLLIGSGVDNQINQEIWLHFTSGDSIKDQLRSTLGITQWVTPMSDPISKASGRFRFSLCILPQKS